MNIRQTLIMTLCFMGADVSFAHSFEIFSIQSLPVQTEGFEARVCRLDEMKRIEAGLTDFTGDIEAIKAHIRAHEVDLVAAINCRLLAARYGIEKLPAIVIDEHFVAYGAGSLSKALEALDNKERAHA